MKRNIPKPQSGYEIEIPEGVEDPIEYLLELKEAPETTSRQKRRIAMLLKEKYNRHDKPHSQKWEKAQQKKNERIKIAELALNGLTPGEIEKQLGVPMREVANVLQSCAFQAELVKKRKAITEELMRDKVPILKEIVGLSLSSIRDFLVNLQTEEGKQYISVRDAKDLTSIAKDLNELLRLELGQSTQNVQVVQFTYDQTKAVLEDLKRIDPVFEYPELPTIEVQKVEELDGVS